MKPDHFNFDKIVAPVALGFATVALAFAAGIVAAAFALMCVGAAVIVTSLLRPVPELKPIPVHVQRRRR